MQASLARGKVECQLRWQPGAGDEDGLLLDETRLQRILAAAEKLREQLPDCAPINPLELLQWPGVLAAPDRDEDALQALASEVFDRALTTLRDNRSREGARLAGFIEERLEQVTAEVERTRPMIPELLRQQRARIEARLAKSLTQSPTNSAWSRNWSTWRRRPMWRRSWTAYRHTWTRCGALSRRAAPAADAWTS